MSEPSEARAGTVALVSGITLLAMHIASMCLGFIPFIGVLAILLVPLIWIVDVVAIGAGVLGLRNPGSDRSRAQAGLLLGILSVLWQLLGLCIGFGVALLAILGGALGSN